MLAIPAPAPSVTLRMLLNPNLTGEPRYAIYFLPAETSAWWRFGCAWLGHDAITGSAIPRYSLPSMDNGLLDRITWAPRHYGFHATLKAPMRLAPGCTRHNLHQQASRLATTLTPVTLTPLTLQVIDGFVALGLDATNARAMPVAEIAAQCVAAFDNLRAPLAAAEIRRRMAAGLTPQQGALLRQWGYPHVFEEFRFHLTLTGRLNAAEQVHVLDQLKPVVEELNKEPLVLDALSLCVQSRRDAPFVLACRYGFDGSLRSYSHE